ncbi:MAG: ATP-binding protein [Longimicrobiaceae bacterium]
MDHLQADIAAVARISAVPTILRVISQVTGQRLALVARVTRESWVACAVLDQMEFGLGVGDQLEVATTLCSEVRDSHEPIIIEHASREPEFCEHPTPRLYGLESYIAVPIFRPDGEYFGNVCALDSLPATLRDDKTLPMMKLFAELISLQLAAEEESHRDRVALADERATAELREQFIAVLGHDLRNPLSSILMSAGFLLALPQEPRQQTVLERIHGSGERMSRMIDDILDFARGRLGGGMPLTVEPVEVDALVGQVVDEVASARPDRAVRFVPSGVGTASLDRSRVAQMLSNLVSNAVEHGSPGEPVEISATGTADRVVLAVANRGEPIAPDVVPRLFEPYVRPERKGPRPGLGLGLYIAAEIARAHGGSIRAESSVEAGTVFTVELPRGGGF